MTEFIPESDIGAANVTEHNDVLARFRDNIVPAGCIARLGFKHEFIQTVVIQVCAGDFIRCDGRAQITAGKVLNTFKAASGDRVVIAQGFSGIRLKCHTNYTKNADYDQRKSLQFSVRP